MIQDELLAKLNGRGFKAERFATGAEAKARALEIIGGRSVGIGGSATVRDLLLYETLKEQGNEVYWHWKVEKAEKKAERRRACAADVYISSANAILTDGRLVNIDGTGNRVAGLIYGPGTVIVLAGRNKIVEGGLDDAVERIKRCTCPKNAQRQNFDTPCANTGKCADCRKPDRMCCVTTVHETPIKGQEAFYVLLFDEEMGL